MKEMSVSETSLRDWILATAPGGDLEHKALNHFLQTFLTLAQLWREPLEVILTNGAADSLTTEPYQRYLDEAASGKEVEYHAEQD